MAKVKERPKLLGVFIKPFLCTGAMAAVAYSAYKLIYAIGSGILGTGRFAVIVFLGISILVGIAIYAILIIRTHTITKEDMLLVPKGEKLAKILRIK
jgi:stage V sporulation protein B